MMFRLKKFQAQHLLPLHPLPLQQQLLELVVHHQPVAVPVVVLGESVEVLVDEDLVYLALNKPKGMHSTMSDDQGRPCIGDLVEHRVRGLRGRITRLEGQVTQ